MKIIAMYLPQFHRTEINDRLWGNGYTDWTAVKKARQLFKCHNQPRVPIDDRYYDLSKRETMEWQWSLADKYGICGFCFYHYYFGNGVKALSEPAENLLEWSDLPMRFCFCWANESWVSSWSNIRNANSWYTGNSDRQGREILIEQIYGDRPEWIRHFSYLLPFFTDGRYIKVDGKPLFLIHRPELIPCLKEMTECWREEARKNGIGDIYIIGTGSVPVEGALDACLLSAPLYGIGAVGKSDESSPNIIDAEETWKRMTEAEGKPGTRTYYGAFVDYDDTPRRGRKGTVLGGNIEDSFRKYLPQIMRKNLIAGNEIQFINAWNEWGEGNYLEPDKTRGRYFLEAIRDIERSGDYLTEKEYALRDFVQTHKDLIGKEVYLYGTGANSSAVLSRYEDLFRFAGVVDEKKAGTVFCGKRVFSIEEALSNGAEAMIIAAQTSSVFSVMKQYGAELERLHIPLTDLYGNDIAVLLKEVSDKQVVRKIDYEKRIKDNDVISFDLMDCLLKRNVFSPDIPFISERVRELYDFSVREGKKTVFTVDDSAPLANQKEVLREAGISADNVVVESEYGRNKLNGLFRIIKSMFPGKRILHIGNDLLSDVIAPRVYGLDSIGVGNDWNNGKIIEEEKKACGTKRADKDSLKDLISVHDTVCFDIFDTLITRLCLEPDDLFCIMEKSMSLRTGIQIDGFADIRLKAQTMVPQGDLHDIYAVIKSETGIAEEECCTLMRYELECEKELTVPRTAVAEMLEYAKVHGKRTILVSDMYISEEMMRDLLDSNGIAGFDELVISCDQGKTKREGLLDNLKLRSDERVLFIGDDERRDSIPAEEIGFDAFHVPSGKELLQDAGINNYYIQALSPAQRFLMGTAAASAFNDPFEVDRDAVLSAYLTISLVLYTSWLFAENMTQGLDGMIFMSRDGRFFKDLYDHVSDLTGKKLPRSFYLHISRLAAVKMVTDRMDPEKIADSFGKDLISGFVSAETMSGSISEQNNSSMDPEKVVHMLEENYVMLAKKAAVQRQHFYRMLGGAGIEIGKKYGLFDFFSGGTIQSILEMIMPCEVKGLYYAVNEDNVHSNAEITGAVQDRNNLLKELIVPVEAFICSGRRSVKEYSNEGPVFFDGQEDNDMAAVVAAGRAKCCFDLFRDEMLKKEICVTAKDLADVLLSLL